MEFPLVKWKGLAYICLSICEIRNEPALYLFHIDRTELEGTQIDITGVPPHTFIFH